MNFETEYSRLPEDLISKILDSSKNQVKKLNQIYKNQIELLEESMNELKRETDLIRRLPEGDHTESIIAVDGGRIVKKNTGTNMLLAVAVGVEGFNSNPSKGWGNQYDCWSEIVPHNQNSEYLCRGIMSLMEMRVITKSPHEIKIIDGTHFNLLLAIHFLLSITEKSRSEEYVNCLKNFLKDKKTPPDLIAQIVKDKKIIAIPKYNSSRDIIESDKFKDYFSKDVNIDDRFFFSLNLEKDEYTKPLSVGQSQRERSKIWNDLSIDCKIDELGDKEEWNHKLRRSLQQIKTREENKRKESHLYFTYYKPYEGNLAYRIECKREIVENPQEFQKLLRSIKKQTCAPYMKEPFPQYLADRMAKSISGGLKALEDSVQFSKELSIDDKFKPYLFNSYRSAS